MGNYNYNNITLDRDRAFDNGNLNELLTQGKNILSEAIRISGKMEEAISNISSTYDGIDGAYKVSAFDADISRLAGTLVNSSYQETIDRMDKVLKH